MHYLTSNDWIHKIFWKRKKIKAFVFKDDDVVDKYNEIWDKIKETLSIKFHSMPVYDEKYIKTKVRQLSGKIKIHFLGDEVPKENKLYTCITCITIDCYENGKDKLSAGLFRM